MRARPKTIRALLIAGIAVCAIAGPLVGICVNPAAAQAVSLSVEFRTALEPYGAWQHHRRWGEVWIPSRVARDWRPYTVGHWVYSQDYGWYWVSDDAEADWGLVTYHYGRWVTDVVRLDVDSGYGVGARLGAVAPRSATCRLGALATRRGDRRVP